MNGRETVSSRSMQTNVQTQARQLNKQIGRKRRQKLTAQIAKSSLNSNGHNAKNLQIESRENIDTVAVKVCIIKLPKTE